MDIFTYLAKGIQCYVCNGTNNKCQDNADTGTLEDCKEIMKACFKDVGTGK